MRSGLLSGMMAPSWAPVEIAAVLETLPEKIQTAPHA